MGAIKETMMSRGVAAVFEHESAWPLVQYPVASAIVLEAMLTEAETDIAIYERFYDQCRVTRDAPRLQWPIAFAIHSGTHTWLSPLSSNTRTTRAFPCRS